VPLKNEPDYDEMLATLKTYGSVHVTNNAFGNWQVTLVNNKNSVVTWDVTSTSEESIRVVYNRLQLELAAAGGMIIE